ncbi:tRNA uridine(34) 5-carboxymethylaminomethyl modification radical SAM/GNAT enzyme Elp3 [Candidatus Woesearchaeota archaeon]|nr:tRNA uridine(34) 5-carboxymethylaminomethyl modification radical SAM/GNAT enzyme Elp3 [Candidatus Woesearchaeota archaeon]
MEKKYFQELISIIKKEKPNKDKLARIKTKLCKKHNLHYIPTDIQILLNVPESQQKDVKKFLLTKPTRSISGVAPVAIMSRPHKCPHGTCTYCPGGPKSAFGDVPQSYTGKEPTTRRAIRNNFDPYLQVMNRLEQYMVTGHTPEKVDLIIMGGTLPSLSKEFQEEFVKYTFKAMNDFSRLFFDKGKFKINLFKKFFELPGDINDPKRQKRIHDKLLEKKGKCGLEKEQVKNETSDIRQIGMTLETRPSHAKLDHANEMLRLGCTRVELGIQTVYDKVLEAVNRGHTLADSRESTRILKDLGFKINYHMMPGLPGVTRKKDMESLKEIFSNPDFRPDMLKIYPCLVMKGTKLYEDWKKGKFEPIRTAEAAKLIAEFKPSIPEWCRMMRVQRDIPTYMTEDGVDKTNLRQYVDKIVKKKGITCRCIRCREIGRTKETIKGYKIKIEEYEASQGKEFFIVAEKNGALIGYCRLRFPSQQLRPEITDSSALIRELHVYGMAAEIGEEGDVQHKGIGKKLLKKAEDIAKKHSYNKIVVISGVGVREYYRKMSYNLEGCYMVKNL